VADDLRQRPGAHRQDGRPRGHGFDRDQAERLRPVAGHDRRIAPSEELVAIPPFELAKELDDRARGFRGRAKDGFVVVPLPSGRADLGRDAQAPPGQPGQLDRFDDPFFGRDPADERQVVAGPFAKRRAHKVEAVRDDGPRQFRVRRSLAHREGDDPLAGMGQPRPGPGQVQAAMEGRDGDRTHALIETPQNGRIPRLEVEVDDVEVGQPLPEELDRALEVLRRIAPEAVRAERPLDRRDQLARYRRVARGEGRDLVAARVKAADELVDAALRAAVADGRHGLHGWSDLGDAQRRH